MKKLKKGLAIILVSSMCLTAFTSIKTVNANEQQKPIKKILWENSGELPPQKGYDKNIGTAGLLYGKFKDYIIVGGGANFPEKSVLEGGAKKTYPDVYLLKKDVNNNFKVIDHIQLPFEIGYGSSITTDKGIYYIGGSTNPQNADDISLFTVLNDKIKYEKIGDLPFTFSDGIAVENNNILYIGFGKQNGKPSNNFISYDLKTNYINKLNTLNDGSVRNQAVAQVLNNNIYLFSGGGDKIFTDGYKYNINKNNWEKVSSVSLNDKEISLYGASSIKLNDKEMLIIGGFDKTIYDNAVKNLNTLKGKELEDFRKIYFKLDPYEYNWNKEILIYNADTNKFRSIGKVPFDAPCGAGLIKDGNTLILINGEIKPGVRTNSIFVGNIQY